MEKTNKRKKLLKIGKALKALKVLKTLTVLYLSFLIPISTLAFSNKDSTNIGVFTNCNNFIVAKKYITVEGCPTGLGNSYINQKGTMTYLARYVGLKKQIPVGIYENNQIGKNAELFKIQANCGFRGEKFSHFDESTDKIHQILPPKSNEVSHKYCYQKCNKYSNLKNLLKNENLSDIEVKVEEKKCPTSSKTYKEYYNKQLFNINKEFFKNVDDLYISDSDCDKWEIKNEFSHSTYDEDCYYSNNVDQCWNYYNYLDNFNKKSNFSEKEQKIRIPKSGLYLIKISANGGNVNETTKIGNGTAFAIYYLKQNDFIEYNLGDLAYFKLKNRMRVDVSKIVGKYQSAISIEFLGGEKDLKDVYTANYIDAINISEGKGYRYNAYFNQNGKQIIARQINFDKALIPVPNALRYSGGYKNNVKNWYIGNVNIEKDGFYDIYSYGDDAASVSIDGKPMLWKDIKGNNGVGNGHIVSDSVYLSKGFHQIIIYNENLFGGPIWTMFGLFDKNDLTNNLASPSKITYKFLEQTFNCVNNPELKFLMM